MTEQPNEAKRLKLHHKAMQAVSKWMDSWEIVAPIPRNVVGMAAFHNLHERLRRVFQSEEAVRADLLAACEALIAVAEEYAVTIDVMKVDAGYRDVAQLERDGELASEIIRARAAVALAKEANA